VTRITSTLHKDQYTFVIISRSILPRMRIFQPKVVENIKTHILCSLALFENSTIYEIIWKNSVPPDRPQIMRMHIACWITRATDTHSEYVILIGFPLQQWLRERASMLRS
jgi:hypothetical protein